MSTAAALSLPGGGDSLNAGAQCVRDTGPILGNCLAHERLLVAGPTRGFLAWSAPQPRRWHLDLLIAAPRGRGTGTALLLAFLQRADQALASVELECLPRNSAFYAHHGFRTALRSPGLRSGGLRKGDLIVMQRGPSRPAVTIPAQRSGRLR
jgi:GNAT superfamily N-acetyltransferase